MLAPSDKCDAATRATHTIQRKLTIVWPGNLPAYILFQTILNIFRHGFAFRTVTFFHLFFPIPKVKNRIHLIKRMKRQIRFASHLL